MIKKVISLSAAAVLCSSMAAYPGDPGPMPAKAKAVKALVVYYSLTGKTEIVAKKIAEKYSADIIRIEEVKQKKPGPLLFVTGGFAARFGKCSAIKPVAADIEKYDIIFVGSPVWADRSTPAVNSFAAQTDFKNKNVVLFFTMGGKGYEEAAENLGKRIEARSGKIIGSFGLCSSKTTPEELKAKTILLVEKIVK